MVAVCISALILTASGPETSSGDIREPAARSGGPGVSATQDAAIDAGWAATAARAVAAP